MEAEYEPQHRTQVNLFAGFRGLGERARQRNALFPVVATGVFEAVAAGHCSTLPQEISTGPARAGRTREGNDGRPKPVEKSDHSIVALTPGNAGRAKGVTS